MLEDKIQNPSACSGSPSEATLWIREVEMVDSVDVFFFLKKKIALNSKLHSFPDF